MSASTIARLQESIDAIRSEIEPLENRLRRLERDLEQEESLHFIAENGIKIEDVEFSCGEGHPWFGSIGKFSQWLSLESKKPWASWNGRIYRTGDLAAGLIPTTKGRTADLQTTQPSTTK